MQLLPSGKTPHVLSGLTEEKSVKQIWESLSAVKRHMGTNSIRKLPEGLKWTKKKRELFNSYLSGTWRTGYQFTRSCRNWKKGVLKPNMVGTPGKPRWLPSFLK